MNAMDSLSQPACRPRKPMPTTPISRRKFTDIWCNTDMPAREMAAIFDRGPNYIYVLARRWNLPPRAHLKHKWPRKISPAGHQIIGQMWDAGVLGSEMAAHFGVSTTSMRKIFRDLGKPPRPLGFQPMMTLDEFLQSCLAKVMKADADRAKVRMRVLGMTERPAGRPLAAGRSHG